MAGIRAQAAGRVARRFESVAIDTSRSRGLSSDHPALAEGRTIFPTTVVGSMESPRFLVSGANNPKLGKAVIKGPRAGWPIYHVTLEERATCPRSCHAWSSCYGSAMPFARRHTPDADFLDLMRAEVMTVARQHPDGLLIRLHTLGDFFSADYVMMWAKIIERFPQVHLFGYTARQAPDTIYWLLWAFAKADWEHWAIRFSRPEAVPGGSIIVDEPPSEPDVILCPAQVHKTEACSSCALCWAEPVRDKTIAFLRHGMKSSAGVARTPRLVASSDRRPPRPPREVALWARGRRPAGVKSGAEVLADRIADLLPSLFAAHPEGVTGRVLMKATGESYARITRAAATLDSQRRAWWIYTGTQRAGKVLTPRNRKATPPAGLTRAQGSALREMRAHADGNVYDGGYKALGVSAGVKPGSIIQVVDALEAKGFIRLVERGRKARKGDNGTSTRWEILKDEIVRELRENPVIAAAPVEPDPAPVSPARPKPRPAPAYAPEPRREREPVAAQRPVQSGVAVAVRDASRQIKTVLEVHGLSGVSRRDAIDRRAPSGDSTRRLMGDPEPGRLVPAEMSADDIARHNRAILAKLPGSAKTDLAAFDAAGGRV